MTAPVPLDHPRPAAPTHQRNLLIGDAERTRTSDLLSAHFAAGRLTAEEFDRRLDAAMAARTEQDLGRLLADLPRLPPPPGQVARSTGAEALDVVFALVAVLAAVCLLILFGLGADRGYLVFGFFAALGGATVASAITHFLHRHLHARRVP